MVLHITHDSASDLYQVWDRSHHIDGLTRRQFLALLDDYRAGRGGADLLFAHAEADRDQTTVKAV